MSLYTVTSNDTLTLNDRVFSDLSTDDVTMINFPSERVTRKTGKNGNTIYAQNAQGKNADLTLRLNRGSSDDQYLQGIIDASNKDFPSTVLLFGTFTKRLGDGSGNVINESYVLSGGAISKEVEGKENVAGDTSQAEAVYQIKFATASRSHG